VAIAILFLGVAVAGGKSGGRAPTKGLDRAARLARWAPLPRGFIGMNFSTPFAPTPPVPPAPPPPRRPPGSRHPPSSRFHVPPVSPAEAASPLCGSPNIGSDGGGKQGSSFAPQAADGVSIERVDFGWSSIERAPGIYDFSCPDAIVADAAASHIDVLPVLLDAPGFLTGRPRQIAPPEHASAIAPFAAALVRRYGPGGTFWSQYPGLPRRPIRWWEIWNEPNLPLFWGSPPNPRRYVKLLSAAHRAIVAVDPGAHILSAPLSPVAAPKLVAYLRGMYAAGARGKLDGFGFNAYATNAHGIINAVRIVHDELSKLDPGLKIWLTEFGWATGHEASPYTIQRKIQARMIHRSLYRLAHKRRALGLRGLLYYNWSDTSAQSLDQPDSWILHTGLNTLLGGPKPGLSAFRRTSLRLLRTGP
jgi:hypothetical protein